MRDIVIIGLGAGNEALIGELRSRGVRRIIGVDRSPEAPCAPLVDERIVASYLDYDRIEAGLSTLSLHDPAILAGMTADTAYGTIFRLQRKFGGDAPSPEAFERCTDKFVLAQYLAANGYDTPETHLFDAIAPSPKEYPIVIKSRHAKNQPVTVCKDADDFAAAQKRMSPEKEPLVVQGFASGTEWRIDIFPDGSHIAFKKVGGALYENVHMGSDDAVAVETVQKFADANGFSGLIVKYDVIVDAEKAYILDIGFDHPLRFFALAKKYGNDFWKLYVDDFVEGNRGWKSAVEVITGSHCIKGSDVFPYEMRRPQAIEVREGHIFVTDRDSGGVWEYSHDGHLLDVTLATAHSGEPFESGQSEFDGKRYTVDAESDQIIVIDIATNKSKAYLKSGRGPGEVRRPTDVEALGGKVYVNDQENYRIQVFTPEMEYIGEFGGKGRNSGEFDMATALAADGEGLLIADGSNDRIVRYDPASKTCTNVVVPSFRPGTLRRPTAVAVGPDDSLYVADRDNDALQAFSADGRLLWHARATRPSGIVHADGRLYVIERPGKGRGTLAIFTSTGERLPDSSGENALAIAADESGNVWVSDGGKILACIAGSLRGSTIECDVPADVRIKSFFIRDGAVYIPELASCVVYVRNPDGSMRVLDLKKNAPDIKAVRSVAIYDNSVVASARGSNAIYLFDLTGKFQKKIGSEGGGKGGFRNPVQVVCSNNGDFLVVDKENDRIVRYTKEWKPVVEYGNDSVC
jgi:hypothetical protein